MHGLLRSDAASRAEIWIVEDEFAARQEWMKQVEMLGHRAVGFANLPEAYACQQLPQVILFGCDDLTESKLAAFGQAKLTWTGARAVIVTQTATVSLAVDLLRRGFDGVLEKPLTLATLQRELRTLLTTQKPISSHEESRRKVQSLTERRQHILHLIGDGLPNKLIASRLRIGLRTVEKERAALFNDLGVRSAAEAAGVLARANLD